VDQVTKRIVVSGIALMLAAIPCTAAVSTNVPLGHWSYGAIDKLADYGLIDGAMLTIRPITRLEMARHIAQATANLNSGDAPQVLHSIIDRLHAEFRDELIQVGAIDGWYPDSLIKPVEDPYVKYLYADKRPDLENMRGDRFEAQSNYRAGFAARGTWDNTVAFYAHPEFSAASGDTDQDFTLIEGYGKSMAGPVEFEVGKDSLWWGPSRRASMLMSNNAQPLPMVKISTPQPVELPWFLSRLGPFKAEWFLAELEESRDHPHAKLSGMRLNFRPHPLLELGASRVMMFGGSGQPRVGLWDYGKMVFTTYERPENNQLAGIDGSVRIPLGENPFVRSVKLYVDAAGEDSVGALPSKWGEILGIQLSDILRTGRTDLRVEFADDHAQGHPGVFYTHSIYTSGYTYEGRVMGHYMGTESRDLSIQLSHYLTDDLVTEVMFDRVTHVLTTPEQIIDIYQCNLTLFPSSTWRIEAGYRYEHDEGRSLDDNHVLQLTLVRHF
jgi:hypothetical protein